MDPSTHAPIVILKDLESDTVLPIWVGLYEANAIALEIEKATTPRPQTHDLRAELDRPVVPVVGDVIERDVDRHSGLSRAGRFSGRRISGGHGHEEVATDADARALTRSRNWVR